MPKNYAKSTTKTPVPEHFYKPPNSSNWYVRLTPPEALLSKFKGKVGDKDSEKIKEFRKSTGHAALRLAKPVGQSLIADKLRQWETLLRSVDAPLTCAKPTILCDSLIETICAARLYSWMSSDEDQRLDGVDEDTLREIEEFCHLSDIAMRSILSQGKASSKWSDVTEDVFDWCTTLGFDVRLEDPYTTKLVREFAKVERQAQMYILKRNAGEEVPTPAAPIGDAPKLSDISASYFEHKSKKSSKSHASTSLNAWTLFVEFAGDIPIGSVSSQLLYQFFENRLHAGSKPWSEKRVASFGRTTLREVFGLAISQGLTAGPNPVDQLTVLPILSKADEASRKKPRFPYSTEQLNRIFSSEWFNPTNTKDFRGKMRTDLGARYWIPIIGTLYGTRVREPLQLLCSDITVESGIHIIRLQDMSDEKDRNATETPPSARQQEILNARSLKNVSSHRTLPLHPKLAELGFVEFVTNRRKQGGPSALLFPSSEPDSGGKNFKLGRAYEQSFLRYVRDKLGFGNGYGNHSYRHQFEDRLRDCQAVQGLWPAGMGQQLTGRKKLRDSDRGTVKMEGSEAAYGKGYKLSSVKPYFEKIDFSDIVFPCAFIGWLDGKNNCSDCNELIPVVTITVPTSI